MSHTILGITPAQPPWCVWEISAEWLLSIGIMNKILSLIKPIVEHKIFIPSVAHSKEPHSAYINSSK